MLNLLLRVPAQGPEVLGLLALSPLAARPPVGLQRCPAEVATEAHQAKIVQVHRRRASGRELWRHRARLVDALELGAFIEFKTSLGESAAAAEAEWRAARQVRAEVA